MFFQSPTYMYLQKTKPKLLITNLADAGGGHSFGFLLLFDDSSFEIRGFGREHAFAETQQFQPSVARTGREMSAEEVPVIGVEGVRFAGRGGCGSSLGGAEFGESAGLKVALKVDGARNQILLGDDLKWEGKRLQ